MDHSWLRFASRVSISSPRSIGDCVSALQGLSAPPGSFQPDEVDRPFRGKVGPDGGYLRNPLLRHTAVNCRVLTFTFVRAESGTQLIGQWRFLNRYRIPVMIYLGLCVADAIWSIFRLLGSHAGWRPVILMGPLIGFAMLYGWAWMFVLLSGKSERQLERGVFYAMESEKSANIVDDLLSVGTSNRSSVTQ